VQPKLLVQLVKVSDEKLGWCLMRVAFRVDGDVLDDNLVGEEGCNSGGSTWGIFGM